jgi:hypothetical protein
VRGLVEQLSFSKKIAGLPKERFGFVFFGDGKNDLPVSPISPRVRVFSIRAI